MTYRGRIPAVVGAAIALGFALTSCQFAPSPPTVEPTVVSMLPAAEYATIEVESLPPDLESALARDLGASAVDYLVAARAASDAASVLSYLANEYGIDPADGYLFRNSLYLVTTDPMVAEAARSVGAHPTTSPYSDVAGPSALTTGIATTQRIVQPAAPMTVPTSSTVMGGMGFGDSTSGSFQLGCTVGFSGYAMSSGSPQFLTSGRCAEFLPGSLHLGEVSAAGATTATQGAALGAFLSGTGLNEPDGVGLVDVGNAATQHPEVIRWGNSPTGAPTSGTPLLVRDVIEPVAGSPVCKSSAVSGWRCGTILEVVAGKPAEGFVQYANFTTNVCALEGESGSPALVGSSAVGILTGAKWTSSCSSTQDGLPASVFISLDGTSGSATVDSIAGARWEPAVSISTPFPGFVTTRTLDHPMLTGTVAFGGINHRVYLYVDGDPTPIVGQVLPGGRWFVELGPDISAGTHTYQLRIGWGKWSRSGAVSSTFTK